MKGCYDFVKGDIELWLGGGNFDWKIIVDCMEDFCKIWDD